MYSSAKGVQMQYAKMALVLIVEDEATIALAVAQELEDQGFRTCIVSTTDEAMATPIDELVAAIVNLRLGTELAGQRIIRHLREHIPGLPIVVMTGYDREWSQADLRGLGPPTIRLHKPNHLHPLVPSVREVIERGNRSTTQQHRRRRTD
jgi:DNA-binding response OmpR family regulator